MGIVIQSLFLVLAALASVSVCGGLLAIFCRVLPLVRRQRVTLWGVRS